MNSLREFFNNHRALFYAMSMAASWAWGTSLVVGMEIVQTRGAIPFIIWATANSLAIPLFGLLARKLKGFYEIVNSKAVTVFTTCVQVFCIWIQMNAIYQYLGIAGVSDLWCKVIPIIVASVFLILLFKNGLIKAIVTDNPIWYGVYGLMLILVVLAFVTNAPTHNIVTLNSTGDISWALYTAIVLFSGPIMGIPFWQYFDRCKQDGQLKAFNVAGLLFGAYTILIFVLAHFSLEGTAMIWILVACIFLVAISSINSAVVAMQRLAGYKVGFGISACAIAGWQIVIPMGVMGLWLTMGTARVYVSIICIVLALIWSHRKK